MEIHIDMIPPKEGYFISVELSENESLGLNNTFGENNIKKQVIVGERYPNKDPDGTWTTLKVVDGEPVGKREVEWINEEDVDIINNNAWKTTENIDMPEEIHEKIAEIYPRIYMNRDDLESVQKDLKDLDEFLSENLDEIKTRLSEKE